MVLFDVLKVPRLKLIKTEKSCHAGVKIKIKEIFKKTSKHNIKHV
jgi:hypothetical protein